MWMFLIWPLVIFALTWAVMAGYNPEGDIGLVLQLLAAFCGLAYVSMFIYLTAAVPYGAYIFITHRRPNVWILILMIVFSIVILPYLSNTIMQPYAHLAGLIINSHWFAAMTHFRR